MTLLGWWQFRGWCIIGTGLCDGAASLWPSKEHVPTDGTRAIREKRDGFCTRLHVFQPNSWHCEFSAVERFFFGKIIESIINRFIRCFSRQVTRERRLLFSLKSLSILVNSTDSFYFCGENNTYKYGKNYHKS